MENDPQQNQQVPLETTASDTPRIPPEEKDEGAGGGSIGAVVAICIIIAIIVVGALYAWGARLEKETPNADIESSLEEQYQQEMTREDSASDDLRTQSDSTDISSIEADFESTDFSSIEADLKALDAEFQQ
jgi:cytoskeletal protein RodZ